MTETKQNYKKYLVNYTRYSGKPDFFYIYISSKVENKEIVLLEDEIGLDKFLVQIEGIWTVKINPYSKVIWCPVWHTDLFGVKHKVMDSLLDPCRFCRNINASIVSFFDEMRTKYPHHREIPVKLIKVKHL